MSSYVRADSIQEKSFVEKRVIPELVAEIVFILAFSHIHASGLWRVVRPLHVGLWSGISRGEIRHSPSEAVSWKLLSGRWIQ